MNQNIWVLASVQGRVKRATPDLTTHSSHCELNGQHQKINSPYVNSQIVQYHVKMLTGTNMHGNVIRLLDINGSKAHMHNTHSLRSIVINNITQELP